MQPVQLSSARLSELVERFSQARVAVIGDFFLDKYLDVDPGLAEISVETGLAAHQVIDVRCSPGAAGTVVCNLAALGVGELHAIGFTGDDGESYDLRKELARLNCRIEHLHVSPERRTPTYLKPRDAGVTSLSAEHSRYDTKNRRQNSRELEQRISKSMSDLLPQIDALVILDQVEEPNCGAVTQYVRNEISRLARETPGVHFWADSRRRIQQFSDVIVKPNQFEAVGRDDPMPDEVVAIDQVLEAADQLRMRNRAPVIVTRGAAGMIVSDPVWTRVPAVQVEGEIDPTGAGDSATAGSVLALCAGAQLSEAALIGNLVASVTIRQIGTTGVAQGYQLADQLKLWQQQRDEAS